MTDTQNKLQSFLLDKVESLNEDARQVGPNGKVVNGELLNQEAAKEYYDGLIQGYTSFMLSVCDAPELLEMSESEMSHHVLREAGISMKDIKKSPKMDQLKDFYKQLQHDEPNAKVVIFTKFERMARLIHESIPDSLIYTGKLSDADKEYAKEQFVENPHYKVIVATDALSTGERKLALIT